MVYQSHGSYGKSVSFPTFSQSIFGPVSTWSSFWTTSWCKARLCQCWDRMEANLGRMFDKMLDSTWKFKPLLGDKPNGQDKKRLCYLPPAVYIYMCDICTCLKSMTFFYLCPPPDLLQPNHAQVNPIVAIPANSQIHTNPNTWLYSDMCKVLPYIMLWSMIHSLRSYS